MNLLSFIDRFSFKQILSVAIILAIVFAIPTTVWLVQQQTKLYSAAHKEKLPPGYFVEEEPFGQPSSQPPKIERIAPFLGKIDDVVLVWGHDFGQNPMQRAIYFGGVRADEKDILRWQDDMIEVMVPEGAVSGPIRVVEVDKEDTYFLPFTVYSPQTKTKVFWLASPTGGQGNNLVAQEGWEIGRVKAALAGGQIMEKEIKNNQMTTTLLENVPSNSLSHLILYDKGGNLLPFYVNPTEFGF